MAIEDRVTTSHRLTVGASNDRGSEGAVKRKRHGSDYPVILEKSGDPCLRCNVPQS